MVAVGRGGVAMHYSIDPEQLPVTLPPVAEIIEKPEIPEDEVTVEEVTYHWDIIRRATWQTDFSDTYFLDEHTGWTVGRGRRYRSHDRWREQLGCRNIAVSKRTCIRLCLSINPTDGSRAVVCCSGPKMVGTHGR